MEYTTLDRISENLDSMRKPITSSDRTEGEIPYYGASGVVDSVKDYIFDEPLLLVSEDGANLLARSTPIAFSIDGKTWVNNHAHVLRFKDRCLQKYVEMYLNHISLEPYITGSAQPKLNQKKLNEIPIPVADYNTMIRAVATIEKVNAVIEQRKQELEKLDELIKARFVELFENGKHPVKKVEEVCSDIVDCPHTTPKYEGELVNPAIRTSEIKKGYITWDTMRYVSDTEYEERVARLVPQAGDIVYGREGTIGNAAVLPKGYKFCLGQRVMLLRPDYNQCSSEYLLHAIISDEVYRQVMMKNNASTVAHVNVKDVKQFVVPVPPMELQHQFADFVNQVDKSKVVVQKALNETQKLFDSLMQKYFG